MNKSMFKVGLSAVAALVLAGCFSGCTLAVPKTKITGSIGGAPFSISGPKDTTLSGLKVEATKEGTLSVQVQELSSKNNPEVIGASAAAYTAQVKALSDAFQAGLDGAAKLTAKGAAAAATGGASAAVPAAAAALTGK